MESDQFITAKDLISLGLTYSISSANNMMFRVRKECNIAPYGKVTYQNYLSVFVKPRNRKCKWQGKDEEKAKKRIDEYMTEDICPKCGKNEFYGLLQ